MIFNWTVTAIPLLTLLLLGLMGVVAHRFLQNPSVESQTASADEDLDDSAQKMIKNWVSISADSDNLRVPLTLKYSLLNKISSSDQKYLIVEPVLTGCEKLSLNDITAESRRIGVDELIDIKLTQMFLSDLCLLLDEPFIHQVCFCVTIFQSIDQCDYEFYNQLIEAIRSTGLSMSSICFMYDLDGIESLDDAESFVETIRSHGGKVGCRNWGGAGVNIPIVKRLALSVFDVAPSVFDGLDGHPRHKKLVQSLLAIINMEEHIIMTSISDAFLAKEIERLEVCSMYGGAQGKRLYRPEVTDLLRALHNF